MNRTTLENWLAVSFPGSRVDLREKCVKVAGRVVWKGFSGDQADRQDRLWPALRNTFGEDTARIGMLMLLTPREEAEILQP